MSEYPKETTLQDISELLLLLEKCPFGDNVHIFWIYLYLCFFADSLDTIGVLQNTLLCNGSCYL